MSHRQRPRSTRECESALAGISAMLNSSRALVFAMLSTASGWGLPSNDSLLSTGRQLRSCDPADEGSGCNSGWSVLPALCACELSPLRCRCLLARSDSGATTSCDSSCDESCDQWCDESCDRRPSRGTPRWSSCDSSCNSGCNSGCDGAGLSPAPRACPLLFSLARHIVIACLPAATTLVTTGCLTGTVATDGDATPVATSSPPPSSWGG
eukprot:scaffold42355_cov62-Phaeocystis_antarctica.AAC.4